MPEEKKEDTTKKTVKFNETAKPKETTKDPFGLNSIIKTLKDNKLIIFVILLIIVIFVGYQLKCKFQTPNTLEVTTPEVTTSTPTTGDL